MKSDDGTKANGMIPCYVQMIKLEIGDINVRKLKRRRGEKSCVNHLTLSFNSFHSSVNTPSFLLPPLPQQQVLFSLQYIVYKIYLISYVYNIACYFSLCYTMMMMMSLHECKTNFSACLLIFLLGDVC